ncbi:hypothetical protein OPT61_g3187 [Boeremia exigua]|uniref:Uncharacterized protein n=1 Tax=Boeremia exigua TaxID=749465 RepID=A0ACC2IIT5_9PLEO|nr:hypothetical protein OPT61_g3187 [Boeremia exigua]
MHQRNSTSWPGRLTAITKYKIISPHYKDDIQHARDSVYNSLTLSSEIIPTIQHIMGDVTSSSTSTYDTTSKKSGIMLVRPSLHSQTDENTATFKRWTVMHFNDLLHCPPATPSGKGIIRALRYTNTDGQLLYIIHADDLSIWQTSPYYAVSRRLDLESTKEVASEESAVLSADQDFGDEPMVWHLVDAAFGIFEEHVTSQSGEGEGGSYHSLPDSLLLNQEKKIGGPQCVFITLTYTSSSGFQGEDDIAPPKQLTQLQSHALKALSVEYSHDRHIYTSVYRHRPEAQPDMHPTIAEGADGCGSWVACIFAEGEAGEAVRTKFHTDLEHLIQDAMAKERVEERNGDWGVKVGVWKGEVFMHRRS